MPIYDYRCEDCGTDFELLVRSDTTLECPRCHGARLERRLSLPAPAAAGGRQQGASGAGQSGGGCCGGSCHTH